MPKPIPSLHEYFWSRVKIGRATECWEWIGRKDRRGYGVVQIGVKGVRRTASRVAWEMEHNRDAPSQFVICHKCDNPSCVNPLHLFMGTQKENLQDSIKKGRFSSAGRGWERTKTHCSNGHEFNELNTYRWKNKRICRTCHAANEAKRRARAA
jgi:hypothetical protein